MAKSERGTRPESLADVLNDERGTSASGSKLPARGDGVTADNTRQGRTHDTHDYESGKGRHRR